MEFRGHYRSDKDFKNVEVTDWPGFFVVVFPCEPISSPKTEKAK